MTRTCCNLGTTWQSGPDRFGRRSSPCASTTKAAIARVSDLLHVIGDRLPIGGGYARRGGGCGELQRSPDNLIPARCVSAMSFAERSASS